MVVSIQARKTEGEFRYECLTEGGRETTRKDVFQWVKEVTDRGAGELLITSVNQEGTGGGYDCELTGRISDMVSIPVVACGGAGNHHHVEAVIKQGKADAVSLASLFHYKTINILSQDYQNKEEGNIDFLNQMVSTNSFSSKKLNLPQ